MTPGLSGDINNSILLPSAYPLGRTYGIVPNSGSDFTFRNNFAGELGGLNQDYRGMAMTAPNSGMAANTAMAKMNGKTDSKPAIGWLGFAIVFLAFVFLARRYAPDGEQYALIKPNLVNAFFVTFWTILIITLLKVIAGKVKEYKIPFLQSSADLVLAA